MNKHTDAFFLLPRFQTNSVDLAYLVTPKNSGEEVFVRIGVLGQGIVNSGLPGGARFGFDDQDVRVLFRSPAQLLGDFNNDSRRDIQDLDLLSLAVHCCEL